jgi:hypothetical protein
LLLPYSEQSGCGCLGNFVERTPQQALQEDLIFVGLAIVAFVGRRPPTAAPQPRWPRWAIAFGGMAGIAFCLLSPRLPLDNMATRLKPGVAIGAVKFGDQALDNYSAGLQDGRHLVLLWDRSRDDEATKQAVDRINTSMTRLADSGIAVWGLAEKNEELSSQFFWRMGPQFDFIEPPHAFMRALYRKLPRAALIVDKQVVKVWNEIPDEATLQALPRGESP